MRCVCTRLTVARLASSGRPRCAVPLSAEGFVELPLSAELPPGRLWVNTAAQLPADQNRVRLDLVVPDWDLKPLLMLGAEVLDDPSDPDEPWALADPEGNEFSLTVVRRRLTTISTVTVDCREPRALAAWWADLIGGQTGSSRSGARAWVGGAPSLPWESWWFEEEPEPGNGPNRWHWDVDLAPGIEPSALVAAGATVLRPAAGDQWWTIMADPEGNVFCAFPPDR